MTKPKKRASPKGKKGVVVRVEKINNDPVLVVGPDNDLPPYRPLPEFLHPLFPGLKVGIPERRRVWSGRVKP